MLIEKTQGHPNTTSPFTLVIAPAMEPRLRAGPNGSPMVRGFHAPRSTVDTKSIFVGNLPETVTRHELETMFREFGRIIQVNVIRKNFSKLNSTLFPVFIRSILTISTADGATNVFAFIEYASCHEADRAALAEVSIRLPIHLPALFLTLFNSAIFMETSSESNQRSILFVVRPALPLLQTVNTTTELETTPTTMLPTTLQLLRPCTTPHQRCTT